MSEYTKWIVWLNFVRDAYGDIHDIVPRRDATGILERYMQDPHNEAKLRGLFNSATGHEEAARQLPTPPKQEG